MVHHEPGGELELYKPASAARYRVRASVTTATCAESGNWPLKRPRRPSASSPRRHRCAHITEFADNAVNLLLRFWIDDPASGVVNVKGDVFLALWDRFKEHGIELPFPQRDLHIRDLPAEMLRPAALKSAAD